MIEEIVIWHFGTTQNGENGWKNKIVIWHDWYTKYRP